MIKKIVISKKYKFASSGELDAQKILDDLEEILKSYFSGTYSSTNFHYKKYWTSALDESKNYLSMVIGESLMHWYMKEIEKKIPFGKGFLISRSTGPYPKSIDAFSYDDTRNLIGESKYIKEFWGCFNGTKDDYLKLSDKSQEQIYKIIIENVDDFGSDLKNEDINQRKNVGLFFGIYEKYSKFPIEYMEKKIKELENTNQLDPSIIYKWILMSNEDFELIKNNAEILIREWETGNNG